jgi:hypothetical protein
MARVYCMLGRLTFPRPRPWRPVHGDALFSAQLVSVGTRLTATHGATAEPLVPPPPCSAARTRQGLLAGQTRLTCGPAALSDAATSKQRVSLTKNNEIQRAS